MTKPISITLPEDLIVWVRTQSVKNEESASRYVSRVLRNHQSTVAKKKKSR